MRTALAGQAGAWGALTLTRAANGQDDVGFSMRMQTFPPGEPTVPSNPHEERARITMIGRYVVSVAGGSVPFEEIRARIRRGELLEVRESGHFAAESKRWVIDRRTGECIYSETRWKSEPWVANIVGAAEALPQAEPVIVDPAVALARYAEAERVWQAQVEEQARCAEKFLVEQQRAILARLSMRLVE